MGREERGGAGRGRDKGGRQGGWGLTLGCTATTAFSPLKSGVPSPPSTTVSGVTDPAARIGGSGSAAKLASTIPAPPATERAGRAEVGRRMSSTEGEVWRGGGG